jgi:hypothetical protein
MFTSADDVVIEPHMKLLMVVRSTFRELEAFKQVEPAVGAHGIKVFLAVLAVAAGKQQATGAIRHQFTTIGAWLVRVTEHQVSRHLLHGSRWLF